MRAGLATALAIVIGLGLGGQARAQRPGLVVFNAGPEGPGANELFIANLSTGRVWQITHGEAGGWDPSWAPDGRRIVFDWVTEGPCTDFECSRIYVVNADGSQRRALTPLRRRCEQAVWSPTGDRIAYVQWRKSRENRSSIWVRSIDGTDAHRLTFANAFDSDPVWSPDGSRLIFARDAKGADYGNYIVNSDGTNLTRLRGNPDTLITSWSPDGRHLAGFRSYGRFNNKFLSVVVNADGSGERLLLRGGSNPVWSPDGKRLAFLPEDDLNPWVSVIRTDGTHRHKLFSGRFMQPRNLDWLRP